MIESAFSNPYKTKFYMILRKSSTFIANLVIKIYHNYTEISLRLDFYAQKYHFIQKFTIILTNILLILSYTEVIIT